MRHWASRRSCERAPHASTSAARTSPPARLSAQATLATSYFQVTLWALIPSVLYYVACFSAVHFEAKRQGLKGVPDAEVPRLAKVMRDRGHLFIPVLLVLFGMILGYSAPLCALVGALGLAAVFSFAYGIAFAITVAAPACWLGHLALLARPADLETTSSAAESAPALEWYPVGRIIAWTAGFDDPAAYQPIAET